MICQRMRVLGRVVARAVASDALGPERTDLGAELDRFRRKSAARKADAREMREEGEAAGGRAGNDRLNTNIL